jgi:hypothetical protein
MTIFYDNATKQKQTKGIIYGLPVTHSLFSGDRIYDAVISGALKTPRLLPRTLIGHEAHVGTCPCASVSRAVLSLAQNRQTATPNLREIAHNPRTDAQFDKPLYPPIRRLQILGPIATHRKLKRIWRASHGIPFSLFGPVYR